MDISVDFGVDTHLSWLLQGNQGAITRFIRLSSQYWMDLMNFMIDELKIRENQAHKGIKSLRIALSNQKENLLAFAQVLDQKLADIAHKFQISLSQVRQVCLLMKKS